MPRLPRLQASLVLLLAWELSCQKRQVAVPIPSPPTATQQAPTGSAPAATNTDSPSSGAAAHPQDTAPYQVNRPPEPTPAAKKPVRAATAPAVASPTLPTLPASPSSAPKLGDILTPDERKQYSAAIDQSLSHARNSLNSIGGRQLTKGRQAEVEQIRNFMEQAQATRASDPAGAKSLAERAEVLARDLAASSR